VAQICASGHTDGVLLLPHRWQRTVDNLGDYFESCYEFVRVVSLTLFVPYSFCTPKQNNETMDQRRTVRLSTERILPSDVTVYKCHMLSEVPLFSISCIATFWQKKNSCHDLCNDTRARAHVCVLCAVLSSFLLALISLT